MFDLVFHDKLGPVNSIQSRRKRKCEHTASLRSNCSSVNWVASKDEKEEGSKCKEREKKSQDFYMTQVLAFRRVCDEWKGRKGEMVLYSFSLSHSASCEAQWGRGEEKRKDQVVKRCMTCNTKEEPRHRMRMKQTSNCTSGEGCHGG